MTPAIATATRYQEDVSRRLRWKHAKSPNCNIGASCHKYHFCREKNYKHVFVATKHVFCRDKIILAATKVLSWQKRYLWHLAGAANDKTERFEFGQDGTLLGLSAYPPFSKSRQTDSYCLRKLWAKASWLIFCRSLYGLAGKIKTMPMSNQTNDSAALRCLIFPGKAAWNLPAGPPGKRPEISRWEDEENGVKHLTDEESSLKIPNGMIKTVSWKFPAGRQRNWPQNFKWTTKKPAWKCSVYVQQRKLPGTSQRTFCRNK